MTGIICAMDLEAHLLLNEMRDTKCERISGIDFVCGTLYGRKSVIAVCGVGKVFAAICAQTMILRYAPDVIINTGVGGSLTGSLHCRDVAVATSVVQHDVDTTALGDPRALVSGINKINFECDKKILAEFEGLRCTAEKALGIKCVGGVIVSGDKFINSASEREFLHRRFGGIACDMESGAIGHTCYVNGVPFSVIRSVSDSADGGSHMEYAQFAQSAADNTAKLLKIYFEYKKGKEQ